MEISNIIIWKFGAGTCDFMVRGGKLIWEDKNINRPTDSELKSWESGYKIASSLQELRKKRNQLLAASDWTGLADSALTTEQAAEWRLYRQKLRDLPKGLTTEAKVKAATWPTKP